MRPFISYLWLFTNCCTCSRTFPPIFEYFDFGKANRYFSLSLSLSFQSYITNNKICNQCLDMIILIRSSLCNVIYKKNRNENSREFILQERKILFLFPIELSKWIYRVGECHFFSSPFLHNKEKDVITNYIISIFRRFVLYISFFNNE